MDDRQETGWTTRKRPGGRQARDRVDNKEETGWTSGKRPGGRQGRDRVDDEEETRSRVNRTKGKVKEVAASGSQFSANQLDHQDTGEPKMR